ncbi:MAG: hypothetical protein ACPHK8_00505 [Thermoplasmatota archaeon]
MERDSQVVLTGFILSLVAFMVAFFLLVTFSLNPEDRSILFAPWVRLTHSAFFGLGALIAIAAARAQRRWWGYLLCAAVPIIQFGVPVYYFLAGRAKLETATPSET